MRAFAGLVRQECLRLALRRRTRLVAEAFVVVGIGWIAVNRSSTYVLPAGRMQPTGPMLAIGAIDSLAGVVLFAPLLLGGTLAEDRLTGLSRLLLSRCGSRAAWVSSKIVGAALFSAGFFLATGGLLTGAAAAVAGWESTAFAEAVGVQTEIASRPVTLIAVSCVALALASTATASLSCVAAFFARSPAVSLLVPVIVVFAGALALPPPLNPYVRAGFLGVFFDWNSLSAVFAYWSALLAVGWLSAVALSVAKGE